MKCKQYLDLGYLHPQSRLVFVTQTDSERNVIFNNKLIANHVRTACIQPLEGKLSLFRKWGFSEILSSSNMMDKAHQVILHGCQFGSILGPN